MSMSMSQSTGAEGLQHALTAASGLHAEAALLEPSVRAVYVREITEAGALFAYTDPDNSPVGGFLMQDRRIALAEQVNRAVLSESLYAAFLLFSTASLCLFPSCELFVCSIFIKSTALSSSIDALFLTAACPLGANDYACLSRVRKWDAAEYQNPRAFQPKVSSNNSPEGQ